MEIEHLGRLSSLPDELRLETSVDIFKNKLKTLLFNQAYMQLVLSIRKFLTT